MKNINHLSENLKKFFIISLLTFFIFLTRGSHLLSSFNLPDATFVLLFAGGILLKEYKWLFYFLILSFGIDFLSPPYGLENSYLFNLGYVGLMISYLVSWFLGRYLGQSSIFSIANYFYIGTFFIMSSYLISTLTFYYFSGLESQEGVTSFLASYYQEFFIVNIIYLAILFISIKFSQRLVTSNNTRSYE
jgi:hypothetical protein